MRRIVAPAVLVSALLVSGCTGPGIPTPQATDPTGTANAEPIALATGLKAPWSVVRLDSGGALISQRDGGEVLELTASGDLREAGVVPGVVSGGESGLHGLAVLDDGGASWLYAYHGAEDDNRVVRMPLVGEPGSLALDVGASEVVIEGIPRASNHDGGRIAFGPDGMLYIATGDAGQRDRARDRDFLGGKILRVTPEGEPARGNPFGSPVYSIGHRNVQGLAWTDDGTLWASEFGQNTWDELNRIEAGGDYGWPDHEGFARVDDAIDPVAVWTPDEASPSGIAVIDDVVYVAGLRGQRLWLYDTAAPSIEPWPVYTGEFGRLRDVIAGPDDTFWVLTNNTDGRGSPGAGDDRLLQLTLPEG
ncbi:PQQ-dependent sugar dehydrogenase [Microbacterium esteraromaticum]|uniref:PQQ-dependent sugar dehydrogenase n=1 Tax=Microbacterium esteraromaticum TaxID=57043 RepID=A0A7D7WCH7_9MICO|nr:PQQ-dependent sugar dehydrogenase [Microbacterium esteraromaticum]QMU96699.1 PQQ-dependent sugar dehydrogenase [Microbacterium esteraromaticum]